MAVIRTLNGHWPEPPFVLDEYIVIVVSVAGEQPLAAAYRPGTTVIYFVNRVRTDNGRPEVEVVDLR